MENPTIAPALPMQPARPKIRRGAKAGLPYASATAGTRAREETIKWLRRLGCEGIGFYDHFEEHQLELAFKYRGQSYLAPVVTRRCI